MAKKDVEGFVGFEIINDKETLAMFNELKTTVQNQIVYGGLRKSAKIITNAIKSEYNTSKKNKTKSQDAHFKDSLRVSDIKSKKISDVGLKIGTGGFWGYKFRWMELGTVDRYRRKSNKGLKNHVIVKKPFWTGKVVATHFFEEGVNKSKEQAQATVIDSVIKTMDNTVKRYEKKGKK